MAWVLCFIASLLLLVIPIGQNIEAMANKVEELSALDRSMAEKADAITAVINSSLHLNSDLLREQRLCLLAVTPQEKLIHQLNAQSIILSQDTLLAEANLLIRSASIEWSTRAQLPLRVGPMTCLIPGPLLCVAFNVFSLESRKHSAPGGVLARPNTMSTYCPEIYWEYSNTDVRPL